ncbi:MAG TPA: addiction module protein [Methylomirabilota bacterium]|nr:addiction module protein [Methylomirabilota bacterium]
MARIELSELLDLPVSERLRLLEAIWDSIAEWPGTLPLTDAEREELDRRWVEYAKNPIAGSPWPEVKGRLLSRR